MNLIRFNVDDKLRDAFKLYCVHNDTTMSKILIDYITTLVAKPAAKKKNSVKPYYCGCGLDLSTLPAQDRLDHVKNCISARKE